MEAFLDGPPQFILVSVNALLTTAQATYINRLKDLFGGHEGRERLEATTDRRWQWHALLTGWWLVCIATIFTIFRIALRHGTDIPATDPYFIIFDFTILLFLFLGYVSGMICAMLAYGIPGGKGPWPRQNPNAGTAAK